MKVLSTKPRPIVAKKTDCRHCGARLEYVPLDVKKRVTDYTDGPFTVRYVVCGNCDKDTEVS